MNVSEFVGKTFKKISVNKESTEIIFIDTEKNAYKMYHEQDCCEGVCLEDVVGELTDLIDSPILFARESSNKDNVTEDYVANLKNKGDDHALAGLVTSKLQGVIGIGPKDKYDESYTWTFYHIATIRGYVTLRWYGTSNGYYSESVDIIPTTL